jgi:hypothetical protein
MSKTEDFYEFLTEDTDARICESVPDEQFTDLLKNFLLNVLMITLLNLEKD